MAIIQANNVSIRYIKGDFKSIGLKEYVMRRLTGNYKVVEFWADRNISFSLEKGDLLGIVGTNGAGKSTLLKAISGIMQPSEGCLESSGTIADLLELASGFDGDLTVRESTYLRGALMGYTRAFMNQMYDQIIAFAELEEFQELPFKQLSSGMKSRLSFSIACLVSPDILILDEVLSVGDGAFKKKSEAKMRQILSNGVTGILVSHSIPQVRNLCNKILWLDHRKQIAFSEDVSNCCNAYEEFLITRKLPKNDAEIGKMSASFQKRQEEEKRKTEETERKKLQTIIAWDDSELAVEAAVALLLKKSPHLLKEEKPAGS